MTRPSELRRSQGPFEMTIHPPLRIALSEEGVSIWSADIFGEASRLREFLARAFSVAEVLDIELRRPSSFGRIRYRDRTDPARIWRELGRVLSAPARADLAAGAADGLGRVDATAVYLEGAGARPIRVSRVGDVLSTWHLRRRSEGALRFSHPVLRHRRDLVMRVEHELSRLVGVEWFRVNALTGSVSIRFDREVTSAERITRDLEHAWPRVLEGVDESLSPTRLIAAVGLVGLSLAGRYVAPAATPIALAGVTLYSSQNVVNAVRQLTRGQVGVSALYTTGLAFMLASGSPVAASVMATLTQFWPQLTRRKVAFSQRLLFAGQRRLPSWARALRSDGTEAEVALRDLRRHDRIVVRSGEVVPADGLIEDGAAAVLGKGSFGKQRLEDSSTGDAVAAGVLVLAGKLTVRLEREGSQTTAGYVDSLLPRGPLEGLPSSLEVERIANRNAKPALVLSLLNLFLTRNLRRSTGIIRPDYATAPRLSAQLSALRSVAVGLDEGVLFKNLAGLERVAKANVYVFDDSSGLARRRLEVATVEARDGISAELVIGYALVAQRSFPGEQGRALAAVAAKGKSVHPRANSLRRAVGVTRYSDHRGRLIEIATPAYVVASNLTGPQGLRTAFAKTPKEPRHDLEPAPGSPEASAKPIWVLRNGRVLGTISFARTGDVLGRSVVARLRARNQKARLVYVSHGGQSEAQLLAHELGIGEAHGDLTWAKKVNLIRAWGSRTLWVGDGSDSDARGAIEVSSVSVSVAPLSRLPEDAADVLLPLDGAAALPSALTIGRAHAQRLVQDYRTVYWVNLLGVAGAFVARFSGLQSGLLSNVGTGVVYARHARALNRLVATAEARRARIRRAASG